MTTRIPAPRLLPITILAMAALLSVKSVALVQAAVAGSQVAAATNPPAAAATNPPATAAANAPGAAAANAPTPPANGHDKAGVAPKGAKPDARERDAAGKTAVPQPKEAGPPAPIATQPAGAAVAPTAASPPQGMDPPIGESERALLLDLRARRGELEKREAAMQAREQIIAAAERRLTTRVDELGALQGRLEALEKARQERDAANWQGLVKLYEGMKPRDAAAIFNDLDLPVLLQVVDRMKENKASMVLAAMQPERARQLTAELAEMRTRANTVSGPASAAPRATPAAAAGAPADKRG